MLSTSRATLIAIVGISSILTIPAGSAEAADAALPPMAATSAAGQPSAEETVNAFGVREAGDWTIYADGSRTMAAASAADCYSGQTCLFQDGNFGGWVRAYTAAQIANLTSPYNDSMSSWINLNSRDAAWYTGTSASGTKHCMPSGVQVAQVTATENDTASSIRVFSSVC